MLGLFPTLAIGVLLGARHATDADHVVAVTTIVARQRRLRDGLRIGAWWGVGHTITVTIVGGAIIGLHIVIPARLGLSLELAVAAMLIALGSWTLAGGAMRAQGLAGVLRPVAVGLVHGLAGSAAIALLVLATIPDPIGAALYLLMFGIGTVVGMAIITSMIALPVVTTVGRFAPAPILIRRVSGTLSVAAGLFIAGRIVLIDGLLGAAPLWTPR